MSVSSSDSGSLRARAWAIARQQRLVERFSVGERGQRIGQAFGADRLEILLQLVDFLLGGREPRFQRMVVLLHLRGRGHQALDDRAHGRVIRIDAELLRDVGEIFGIARRAAGGGADHRHHLLDLVHHLRADAIDALGEAAWRKIGFVDLLDVGVAQRAVARQHLVDHLVQRRIVAGRVGVPDLEMTRRSRLPQCSDLTESNFRERHRAFVIVGRDGHTLLRPRAWGRRGYPNSLK